MMPPYYRPLIEWIGPAKTPSGRTGQKFRAANTAHVDTLFAQLGDQGVGQLIEQAGRWLQQKARQRE